MLAAAILNFVERVYFWNCLKYELLFVCV